jgi:ribosome assembly protein YihI (activator of Der GTPase)
MQQHKNPTLLNSAVTALKSMSSSAAAGEDDVDAFARVLASLEDDTDLDALLTGVDQGDPQGEESQSLVAQFVALCDERYCQPLINMYHDVEYRKSYTKNNIMMLDTENHALKIIS